MSDIEVIRRASEYLNLDRSLGRTKLGMAYRVDDSMGLLYPEAYRAHLHALTGLVEDRVREGAIVFRVSSGPFKQYVDGVDYSYERWVSEDENPAIGYSFNEDPLIARLRALMQLVNHIQNQEQSWEAKASV